MRSSPDSRLIHDLTALAALLDDERPSADERLAAALGPEGLCALRTQLASQSRVRLLLERSMARFARLRQWQWSVLLVSLACGVAVSMMGVIELIWQLRSVLSGVGAVAIVLAVFLNTRHHRIDETWIGS